MSSRLQLDVHNLSLWKRHLVNAYEVKAGIGVIAGKTVWSIDPTWASRVWGTRYYKKSAVKILTFTFTVAVDKEMAVWFEAHKEVPVYVMCQCQ